MESMKSIKIRNRWTGSVVFEYTKERKKERKKEIQSPKRFWKLLDAMLTCAVPTCAVLTCAMLTCAVPTCAVPTCAMPTCAVPRDVIYHARPRVVSSVGKKPLGIS